jgi:hypothetical protein
MYLACVGVLLGQPRSTEKSRSGSLPLRKSETQQGEKVVHSTLAGQVDDKMSNRVESEVFGIVANANRFQTVSSVQKELKKKKISAHWLTIRAALLGLVANKQILGEQVADGTWIFRARQPNSIVVAAEAQAQT